MSSISWDDVGVRMNWDGIAVTPRYLYGRESAGPRRTVTPAEINRVNREFAERESARLLKQAFEYPNEIREAAQLATEIIRAGQISNPALAHRTSTNAVAARLEALRKESDRSRLERVRATAQPRNDRRRKEADEAALALVNNWCESPNRRDALTGLAMPERVKKYLKVGRPKDRVARRLRAILKGATLK